MIGDRKVDYPSPCGQDPGRGFAGGKFLPVVTARLLDKRDGIPNSKSYSESVDGG